MSEVLDALRGITGRDIRAAPDPSLFRPTDENVIVGDVAKLVADTGWQQRISLEETLADMLEYWRAKR